jgi:hypothetical protein
VIISCAVGRHHYHSAATPVEAAQILDHRLSHGLSIQG